MNPSLQILHLGFEDHRRPGSGGGSHRSHEINRRLAEHGHRVEVVAAAFPGAQERVEDGVRYRHVGEGGGYFRSILTYQARLAPLIARRRLAPSRPDIVVEEFAPPFSTLGIGAMAGVPSVGNVQGYFAAEKARQYGVPVSILTAIERWGTRRHGQLIALSTDLAAQLQAAAPASRVAVIGMGVPHEEIARAAAPVAVVPGRMVFLGRLEMAQKGLDLLVEAISGLRTPDAQLLVAGDGRDRTSLENLVRRNRLEDRVTLLGRVTGVEKWRLLASAQISVVPSRYETFGLSAMESLACGTPVAGFDIPSLRETVPRNAGRLAPAFDVSAFRANLDEMLADPQLCVRLGGAGAVHAQPFGWKTIAESQLAVYQSVVTNAVG